MSRPLITAPAPTPQATRAPLGAAGSVAARLWPCTAAALAGLLLLFGVGLAHPHALHQATHDARHAAGFPCH
jgi:cobalt transporter subunit CbtB